MWELIKNNPVVKVVLVLVVGFLGFGILANIVFGFGYSNYGMGHEGGGYGGLSSTTGALVYLYTVVFKLLIFALIISIIVLIVRIGYKYINGEGNTFLKSPFNDPYIKTSAVLGISVLALVIATPILSGIFGMGTYQTMGGYGMRMVNGYSSMNNYNAYSGIDLRRFFVLILKIFLFLSVIGVLAGLVMFFLKNYSGLLLNTSLINSKCANCGSKVDKSVQFCSNCGQKQSANEQPSAPVTAAGQELANSISKPGKGTEKSKNLAPDTKKNYAQPQDGSQPVT